ncbi:hypothetical protein DPMN_167197 [Dreissena polymorpha]|uniref:Uncharacterized protein n=1 Tax=Dreissena polymorpha TaxID=45954 RepID=A0A9D4F3F7_DREPO|nr:hypothetical protein DPMN_167197 [Dreissena polymorpha]
MIANSDALHTFCADIVREHVETYDENCIEDLVSAYIREMKKHEQTNEQTTMSCAHYVLSCHMPLNQPDNHVT